MARLQIALDMIEQHLAYKFSNLVAMISRGPVDFPSKSVNKLRGHLEVAIFHPAGFDAIDIDLVQGQSRQVLQAGRTAELSNLQYVLALLEVDDIADSLDEKLSGDIESSDRECRDLPG